VPASSSLASGATALQILHRRPPGTLQGSRTDAKSGTQIRLDQSTHQGNRKTRNHHPWSFKYFVPRVSNPLTCSVPSSVNDGSSTRWWSARTTRTASQSARALGGFSIVGLAPHNVRRPAFRYGNPIGPVEKKRLRQNVAANEGINGVVLATVPPDSSAQLIRRSDPIFLPKCIPGERRGQRRIPNEISAPPR
jgi:hypothetical protein